MTTSTAAPSTPQLADLVCAVREVVLLERPPAEAARLVAERLEPFLRQPGLLPEQYREGDPQRYRQHLVHTEDDGSFSVVAIVWRPGQQTPIHDHVAWCVAGVYEGTETEQRYELRGAGPSARLVVAADATNAAGTAVGFAPPGDIHLVRNAGATTVISIHIYGAHIGKLGTSVRREYRLPIADA
ncbi:cysteine dioxygenase family protein [Nocardia brasiliensis]|uniref:cysteine dioxygenase family protein n=1 Tax=Nocardia brasiliensis TaxID=37326 RepID=UPI0002F42D6E|nr:cysteine dioxygenase family protein [Nocardia brasiliensis]OCF88268.1 cysteine dioxygenase [Nocardia brasiliensis]